MKFPWATHAWAESFNGTLKVERVNRTSSPTREQARIYITRYIELRYNQAQVALLARLHHTQRGRANLMIMTEHPKASRVRPEIMRMAVYSTDLLQSIDELSDADLDADSDMRKDTLKV